MHRLEVEKCIDFLEEILEDIDSGADIEITVNDNTIVYDTELPTYPRLIEVLKWSLEAHKSIWKSIL